MIELVIGIILGVAIMLGILGYNKLSERIEAVEGKYTRPYHPVSYDDYGHFPYRTEYPKKVKEPKKEDVGED